jgi:ribosome biogenesis protein SSF1/2
MPILYGTSNQHKKRTHVVLTSEEKAKIPRSMVLKMGDSKREVSHSIAQLVRDFRQVMQPHTAVKLRERKSNRLKDFLVMAGPLGVSHLFLFSQSSQGNTSLRVALTPRGPTLNFRVQSYSLCKDIRKFVRNPKSIVAGEQISSPLLVMNNFSNEKSSDKEALLTSVFQNMFPPISAQTTKLGSIKRVMMINKDKETGEIDIRHYAIETKSVDLSRPIKKLSNVKTHLNKRLPDLSEAQDIADYLLDPYGAGGYTSDSEVEEDAMVEVKARPVKKLAPANGNDNAPSSVAEDFQTQKRAIKLIEIGPRLRLELRKIEEGLCTGKTLYHAHYQKTQKEVNQLERKHTEKQTLKDQRRKEQEENVRKKQDKKSRSQRAKERAKEKEENNGDDEHGSDSDDDHMKEPEEMDDYELEMAELSEEESESASE